MQSTASHRPTAHSSLLLSLSQLLPPVSADPMASTSCLLPLLLACSLLVLLLPTLTTGLTFQAYSDSACAQPLPSYAYSSPFPTSSSQGGACYNASFTSIPSFPSYSSFLASCYPFYANSTQVAFNVAPFPQAGCQGNETLIFYFAGYQPEGVCSAMTVTTVVGGQSGPTSSQLLWGTVNCSAVTTTTNGVRESRGHGRWILGAILSVLSVMQMTL